MFVLDNLEYAQHKLKVQDIAQSSKIIVEIY